MSLTLPPARQQQPFASRSLSVASPFAPPVAPRFERRITSRFAPKSILKPISRDPARIAPYRLTGWQTPPTWSEVEVGKSTLSMPTELRMIPGENVPRLAALRPREETFYTGETYLGELGLPSRQDYLHFRESRQRGYFHETPLYQGPRRLRFEADPTIATMREGYYPSELGYPQLAQIYQEAPVRITDPLTGEQFIKIPRRLSELGYEWRGASESKPFQWPEEAYMLQPISSGLRPPSPDSPPGLS